jgi:hypothetical protein
MGPKKSVAKQDIEVKSDIDASEIPSGKKTPVKKVAKSKQIIKDTNNESYDERLKQITIEWNEYNNESTATQKQLEEIENKKLNLLKKLTDMLNEFKELNLDNKSNNNVFILDNKPSTSSKSAKKVESSDSSKESSDNDTNSDDDINIKQKSTQPKSKGKVAKSLTLGAGSSETKPPVKSRAKAKAPPPVLDFATEHIFNNPNDSLFANCNTDDDILKVRFENRSQKLTFVL